MLKNYNDLGDCYPPRPIILSYISLILQIILSLILQLLITIFIILIIVMFVIFYGPVLPKMNLLLHLNYKCVS